MKELFCVFFSVSFSFSFFASLISKWIFLAFSWRLPLILSLVMTSLHPQPSLANQLTDRFFLGGLEIGIFTEHQLTKLQSEINHNFKQFFTLPPKSKETIFPENDPNVSWSSTAAASVTSS